MVADAVEPHDVAALVPGHQDDEVVRGDGERDRTQARFLDQPQGALDHLAVGRGDEHAPGAAGCGRAGRLRGERHEIERRVVARERQVTLELELHHVPQLAADVGQLDGLHGDRRARQTDGDGADREASLVDLGAEGGCGLLGVDGERLEPCAVHHARNETIPEEDERKARTPQHHAR